MAAHASAFTGGDVTVGDTTNGFQLQLDVNGSIDHSEWYLNGQEFSHVVCGTNGGLMVNDDYFSPDGSGLDSVTDSNNDIVITGNGSFPNQISAAVQYRIYSAGDLLRTSYLLTNNTSAATTFELSVEEDPSDAYSANGTSTNGDTTADLNDSWYNTFHTNNGEIGNEYSSKPSISYTKIWGQKPTALNGFEFGKMNLAQDGVDQSSESVIFETITLAPGESYQWIMFASFKTYDLSGDAAADIAAAKAASQSIIAEFLNNGTKLPTSGRLVRNLDLSVANNWNIAAAVPTLANTGAESLYLATGALLAILTGAGFVWLRRRSN
jgi:LPXTG-motif cell wall-anchored protein